jgi:FkbM family methyltransferase
VKHPTYFPKDLYDLTCNEVFVDCGAYDGDTIKSFLRESGSRFDRIVAYEPDPASYSRLEASVATFPHPDRIRVQCAATGAQNGFVSFCASADESSYVSAGTGNLQVPCLTLDDSLRGIRPSYINIDIEGAELDALKGARKVIEEHSPVLTVCSYHSQNHLWRIPLLINSFNKGYAFYLRPHLFEVWDLVCYAICSGASHKN